MKMFSFFAGDKTFAAPALLIQRVAKNMPVTPVPGAPDNIVGIAVVRGKVITLFRIPGNFEYQIGQNHAVIFKPTSSGDGFGILIDRPGELFDSENMPPDCVVFDNIEAVTGGAGATKGGVKQ